MNFPVIGHTKIFSLNRHRDARWKTPLWCHQGAPYNEVISTGSVDTALLNLSHPDQTVIRAIEFLIPSLIARKIIRARHSPKLMSLNLLQIWVQGNLLLKTHLFANLLQFIPLNVLTQIRLLTTILMVSIHLQLSKSLKMSPVSIWPWVELTHRVGVVVDPVDLGFRGSLTFEYFNFLVNWQFVWCFGLQFNRGVRTQIVVQTCFFK